MMDPHVSVPRAKGTHPAATAAPEPAEDPPDQRRGSHGVRHAPVTEAVGGPPASSVIDDFPISTAPALCSLWITAASFSKVCPAYGRAPHVVGAPWAANRSLAAYGIPCSGPRSSPAPSSFSACRASPRARSGITVTKERSFGSSSSMRARYASVRRTGESFRLRSNFPSSPTGANRISFSITDRRSSPCRCVHSLKPPSSIFRKVVSNGKPSRAPDRWGAPGYGAVRGPSPDLPEIGPLLRVPVCRECTPRPSPGGQQTAFQPGDAKERREQATGRRLRCDGRSFCVRCVPEDLLPGSPGCLWETRLKEPRRHLDKWIFRHTLEGMFASFEHVYLSARKRRCESLRLCTRNHGISVAHRNEDGAADA